MSKLSIKQNICNIISLRYYSNIVYHYIIILKIFIEAKSNEYRVGIVSIVYFNL